MAAGLCLALSGTTPAHAAWTQATSRHFTVYSEGSPEKLRGFAERLEKFDFLLRTLTRITDPDRGSPVKVYLLASDGRLQRLTRNANIGGFYSTSSRTAFAVLPRGDKVSQFDFGAQEVMFHEYAHHFMLNHFPAAYPAWYSEGFAEFFSVVTFPQNGSIEYGHIPLARLPGLKRDEPYPIENLFGRDTDGLSLRDGDLYYGTAWLLTHFYWYDKTGRAAEIDRYLKDVAAGVPNLVPDTYFAGGLAGLEKAIKRYLGQRSLPYNQIAFRTMAIDAITLSPVDPAQGALIEDELRLISHPRKDDLPDIVTAIRAKAARFPGSAHALALLAEAQWAAGQADGALADADRAIAIDPASARAYAVRAEVMLERAQASDRAEDWKLALSAIVRANRADTEDPVPLALFYRYHAMRGGKMPDLGYDGLNKAFALLPQNADTRINFAQATADRGDYRTASALLDPIAYSPHASDMREAILRMKAEFDAAARKGAKDAPVTSAPPPSRPPAAAP